MASSTVPVRGMNYGRRLIPTLIDDMSVSTPDYVYALIPRNQDLTGGFDDVTSRDLARAVNRAAFWIEQNLGRSVDFETIAYLGPMDLRYYIVAIAATKVGYKTLFPSPRNSVEGHLALLEATGCRVFISPRESKVDHILSKRSMRHLNVDGLKELLRGDFIEHYEYNKTFEEAAQDPFIVVHTSGSTGLPKPINLCHGGVATVDAHHLISSLDGFDAQLKASEGSVRVFTSLPPFHVAGVLQTLLAALYFEATTVWPPTGQPVSADLIDDLLDNVNVDILFLAPSTLEELSQSQTSLERLKKVKYTQFAGGPLGRTAGDTISRYTTVLNAMGSSESGFFPLLHKSPEDWIYFHFDPRMTGVEFREVSPGLYEQYFTRHDSTDPFHWSFYTFPNRSEFSMNDVYSKHPSKLDLWLYEGRSDDVIVFSNGEKFNPNDMEATLRSCPGVSGALVVGQGRFEAAALLELKANMSDTDGARKEVLQNLSPYVARANERAPAYAKLDFDHFFFTTAGKPMLKTDKGTVKRRATNQAYENEIDRLYADVAGFEGSSNAVQLNPRDLETSKIAIHNTLSKMEGLQNITFEQDLFAAGMDSLQVMNLVRQLRSSFRDYNGGSLAHLISPRTIYSNPNVLKIAVAVKYLSDHGEAASEGLEKERIGKMEEMLAKYSHDLPQLKNDTTQPGEQKLTVILTGSTGSLGSYLLNCLLANTQVVKVICLNRGVDSKNKQILGNKSRGLVTEWGDRVHFLTTDLSKKSLGLDPDEYTMLVKETSAIIHNQWQVDFNLNLQSFEPHIAGVRDLINLSNQSPKRPPILFTSSISTLDNWAIKYPEDKVPESAFHDFHVPSAMGYGESKYVAEQLLEKAGKASGLSAAICRVGQLAGPVVKGGIWNKQEWLPSLIASSKYLAKIPTTLPGQDTVAWIPVDITADIIVDLLLSDIQDTASTAVWTKYHNVVNPQPGSWGKLVPAIIKHFDDKIEPVSFEFWFEALQATASKTDDVGKNPGIKLLEFFEQMDTGGREVGLETEQTAKRSPAMRELQTVGQEWMKIWLNQWDF